MWVWREKARLELCCVHLQLKVRSSWVPTSAHKLSPCHFLHSFNKCLLSVSQCVFAYVQMSFPDTHLPASMSVQLLLCVQNLGSFHTCPHLFTLCILTHLFIPATPLHCLRLSIPVYTCRYLFTPAWTGHTCSHLPTAVHTCLVLQISMLLACVHTCPSWLSAPAHTYFLTYVPVI